MANFCLVTSECINIFTTYIQHKADLIVLHVLLLPCRFSNFFLATFPFFIKWPPMRPCIFLFPSNAIVGLLTNTLRNSWLSCRICQFFCTTSDMFVSILLYVNTGGMFFLRLLFHYFAKALFVQLSQPSPLIYSYFFYYIFFPKVFVS